MLGGMGRLLLRFRWPVFLSLMVGVVLFLTLEKKPEQHRLPKFGGHYEVSPSGRYLLGHDYSSNVLTYYDLFGNRKVFELNAIAHINYGFDNEDGLSLATVDTCSPRSWIGWHCVAGGELQRIFTCNIDDLSKDRNYPRGLDLSPDGRTWLRWASIRSRKDEIEVVDSRTGLIRTHLAYQPRITEIDRGNAATTISQDSRSIVIVTQKNGFEPEKEGWIDFYDLETGCHLPPGGFLEHGYIRAVHFDGQKVMGVIERGESFWLQTYSMNHERCQWKLSDMKPELNKEKQSDQRSRWRGLFNYPNWFEKGVVFTSYEITERSLPVIGVCYGSSSMPNVFAWKIAEKDKLLKMEEHPNETSMPSTNINFVGVLPSFKLLLITGEKDPAAWLMSLEAWRKMYVPWLPQLASSRYTQLNILDGMTGRSDVTLKLPQDLLRVWYHEHQRAIYAMEVQATALILHKYAYPFQRPWKLILSWAGYVLAAMVLLQLLGIGWKWMTSKETKASLPA